MTISNTAYHTIVVGSGSGGMTIAVGLSALGKRVALIEKKDIGGDCTNVGCVPSKTLIHLVGECKPNQSAHDVLATVQTMRNNLRDKETHEVEEAEKIDLYRGFGRFVAPKRLEVDHADGNTSTIIGENIVVATGARPRYLDIPGLPNERVLTNESMFEQDDAPTHLVIAGTGVVAMEMAFAFHKLGSKITMVTRSERVLTTSIPEASEVLHQSLSEHGITVHYNATPQSYSEETNTLEVQANGHPISVANVDKVLLAVGRVRNLDGLDLAKAGVAYDARDGITTDSFGATNVSGVYAIGDVTPTSHFTHSANAQGRRVVQRILFPKFLSRGPEPIYPSATFSDPEVAQVGLLPDEITKQYHPKLVRRIRIDLATLDRGYTDQVDSGFVIIDAVRLTGTILGATIVGPPRSSEMLSLLTLAITQKISLFKIYQMVFPYPTLSEAIKKAADTFVRATLPSIPAEAMAYLRYRWAKPVAQPTHYSFAGAPQSGD